MIGSVLNRGYFMSDGLTLEKRSQDLLMQLPQMSEVDLVTAIREHNAAYWDQNEPQISDEVYDQLVETLRGMNPSAPVLNELGETVASEGPERRFAAIAHHVPMLSLEKCYDDETLNKWRDKNPGRTTVTPKIDGAACAVRYLANGTLELAVTRGDGKKGDAITENVKTIADIPNVLKAGCGADYPIEVRGEVFMRLSRFQNHFADEFVNPRNLAAGALKQKDSQKTAAYGLSFFAYDVIGTPFDTEEQKNSFLEKAGFTLPPCLYISPDENLAAGFRHFESQRHELDYETDGVVMKADLVSLQKERGFTAHHPRYAIAYKFQGESSGTTLLDIEWSVGRSGVITPVAIVEPVHVSGATVSRASLHNAGYLEKLGLSKKAQVEIARRGGVIPQVERVIRGTAEPYTLPASCPSCSGPIRQEGDFIYCEGSDRCPDVLRTRLAYFTKTIDVLGFGKKHLAALVERGLVKELVDLYRLKLDELVTLDRMGEKLAHRLLGELDAKRKLPLTVFLTALGIDEIGATVAETLVAKYQTLRALREASEEELSEIHGIGESIASSCVHGLKARSDEIEKLLEEIDLIHIDEPATRGGLLQGQSVVFTGKMAQLDRKTAQLKVRELGGKTPGSVTQDLSILVIGDDGSPLLGDGKKSSKHKTAEKYMSSGATIQIMSERDFLKMIGEPSD